MTAHTELVRLSNELSMKEREAHDEKALRLETEADLAETLQLCKTYARRLVATINALDKLADQEHVTAAEIRKLSDELTRLQS